MRTRVRIPPAPPIHNPQLVRFGGLIALAHPRLIDDVSAARCTAENLVHHPAANDNVPDGIAVLEAGVNDYIRYYNHNRIKLGLRGLSPVEYRL